MKEKPTYQELEHKITELEFEAARHKRILELLQVRLALITYADTHNIEQLLRKTLDEAEKLTGSTISFYHFVEPDQKNLSLQTWSTRTMTECCKAEGGGLHYPIEKAGVWVDCVYAGKAVIHNDYQSLRHRKGMPEGHAEVIRQLVVPILRQDQIVAILGVGNKPSDYTDDDVDTVTRLADLAWDTVAQKRAEQDLQRERALHETAQELGTIGGWEWDVRKNEMFWTSEIYAIHDLDFDSIVPGTIDYIDKSLLCYAPEDRGVILQAFEMCSSRGIPYDLEFPFTTFKGREKWVRTVGKPVWEGGEVVKVRGNLMDITASKIEADAWRKSDLRYRNILQTTMDGYWMVDRDGRVVDANSAYAAMSGYSRDELIGMRISDLEAVESEEEVQAHIEKLIETKVGRFETRHRRKDGSLYDVEVSTSYVGTEPAFFITFLRDITAQKEMLATISESESKFKRMFEQAPLSYQSLDENGNFSEVNETWLKTLGYTREEVIGKNFRDFLKPEWKEHFARNFPRFKAVGEILGVEFEMVKKDGNSILVSFHGRIDKDSSGRFRRTHCVFRDITSERDLHVQLLEERTRLQLSLDAALAGTWILDLKSGYVEWDARMLKIFDMNAESFDNRISGWRARVHPDDVSKFDLVFSTISDGENRFQLSYRIQTEEGVWRTVDTRATALQDEQGDSHRLIGVVLDISEHIKTQKQLLKDLDLNLALADISKELLAERYDIKRVADSTLKWALKLTRSCHGFVSAIDSSTLENVGHTLTDMFGSECKVLNQRITFPIGEDGRYPGLWGHALNTREPFYTNAPNAHPTSKGLPSGHVPLESFLAVPVMIGDILVGMIAIANPLEDFSDDDLDAINRLAEVYALALHRQNYEREKSLLERQLKQSQKMEAIGTLAGGIAHDFNNILSPILGYAEILEDEIPDNSDLHVSAKGIVTSALRARDLVKQILAFSRQAEQELIAVQPYLIVQEVERLIHATLPKTIRIVRHIDKKSSAVLVDPTQLHQVVMNLITNAYHAMEEDGGELTIRLEDQNVSYDMSLRTHLNSGTHVVLTIADNGVGMDKYVMDQIFDPYFTTKSTDKGTGLGLAVVYGIVRSCGGDILVSSEVDKGTAFEVYLPAYDQKDKLTETTQSSRIQSGSEQILLVDDDLQVLEMEKAMLERMGYVVTHFSDSMEALKAFTDESDAFDLLITDMTMPGLTGDLLILEMKKIKPSLPAIICTGFSEKISPEKAESLGIHGYLMKPVLKADLGKMIRRILDKEHDMT